MKKFLIGCATAAMMLSPAIAEAGGRHGHGNGWPAATPGPSICTIENLGSTFSVFCLFHRYES